MQKSARRMGIPALLGVLPQVDAAHLVLALVNVAQSADLFRWTHRAELCLCGLKVFSHCPAAFAALFLARLSRASRICLSISSSAPLRPEGTSSQRRWLRKVDGWGMNCPLSFAH